MVGGGGSQEVKPLTQEEMKEMTDNPFENPVSGVSAPSWKPDEVKTEKAEIEAQKAADKLKAVPNNPVLQALTKSSGSGKYTMTKKPGGGYSKVKTSTYRKSLRAKAKKKK